MRKCQEVKIKTKTYISNDIVEFVLEKMLGWIDRLTAIQVEKGQVMQINQKDFKNEMIYVQRMVNQAIALIELAPNPTLSEIELEKNSYRTYLRQLQIIEVDYDEQIEAISDFLKASANRTIWAKNADIDSDSVDEYYEELRRRWRAKKNIVEIGQRHLSKEDRGRILYNSCIEDDINIGVFVTPTSYKNGCLHELSEEKKIGWHPDYKEILKGNEEDDRRI